MDEKEKIKERYKVFSRHIERADIRINHHDDNLSSLQVHIATIFLALSPFVFSSSHILEFYTKLLIYFGWISLILSLLFGITDKLVKQEFWKRIGKDALIARRVWVEADKGKCSIKSAENIVSEVIPYKYTSSASWTRNAQMIFLFVGLILQFIAYAFILFSK